MNGMIDSFNTVVAEMATRLNALQDMMAHLPFDEPDAIGFTLVNEIAHSNTKLAELCEFWNIESDLLEEMQS